VELKPRYKDTEIGVIPVQWDAAYLGDKTIKVGSGITPTGGALVYKKHGRPFLRSQNVGWGDLLLDDVAFIDDETHSTFQDTEIEAGDVFLNITGASIGRSAVADARVVHGNVNQHVCIIRTNQVELQPQFLNYFLLSAAGQRQIDTFQAGGNRQGLNFGQVRSFRLPLPPIAEQRAISAALSDVDALLAKFDALIAKKRDLKQAAMQQLLTGKTRLPGFESAQIRSNETEIGSFPIDWPVIKLMQVVRSHRQGYYTKERYAVSGVRLVRITDLLNPRLEYGSMPLLQLSAKDHALYKISVGDFLFARSGAIGRYGIVYEDVDAVFGSYIIRFNFDSSRITNEFLGFLYETATIRKQLFSITQGSSNININASNIKSLQIPLPHIEEQIAIATTLSDMDAEIAALEARRDKTRLLKQGMMQELLTGRTRLV
jgi:type I restriction enzyme S subunit